MLVGFIFLTLFYSNKTIQTNFSSFSKQVTTIMKSINPINILNDNELAGKKMPKHFYQWGTFYDTWLMNKFIGGGVRSFRTNCLQSVKHNLNQMSICSTHPHNFYLEI